MKHWQGGKQLLATPFMRHSCRVPKVRKPKPPPESPKLARSFDLADLLMPHDVRARGEGIAAWTREDLKSARDLQMRGKFARPVALRRALLTEPAIYVAAINRLAPHRGVACDITAPTELTGTALAWLTEARSTFCGPASVSLPTSVHSNAFAENAFHALCIEQIHWETRGDGSREDAFVTPFPLECVEWSQIDKCLIATCVEGRFPVVHGDGRWMVTSQFGDRPWEYGAVVPFADLWGDLAYGRKHRSQNAESHGEDKWIGMLPETIPLDSPDAQALMRELVKLYQRRRAMVIPFGAKVERNQSQSPAWQIFKEILDSGGRHAARILLGTDDSQADGGSNYIKSKNLFGVRNDIVEGDFSSRGAAVSTGLLRPWSLVNAGRWDRWSYGWTMPDADEDARVESIATRNGKFWADIGQARAQGFRVDQAYVNKLARQYKLDPPQLASDGPVEPVKVVEPVPIEHSRKPLRAAT